MENQGEKRFCRRQRVILFPLPFQGHINPMLQLANILYSKGFSITIIHTNFSSVYTSNYPHFTFKPVLDNNSSEDTNLAKLSSKGVGDLISGIMLLNQCGSDGLHQELEQMLIASKQQHEPIVCLITDALWYFTQSVADSLKLPRLVLRTSSLFCVIVYDFIPVLDHQGYFKEVDSVFDEENTNVDLKNIISPNEETDFKKVKGSQSAVVVRKPYFAIRIQADIYATNISQFPSMENQTAFSWHRRIILFPFSLQGHINPMLQLANLLYSKGFSITIIHTNFNAPKASNFPNFTFRSILDNDPQDQRFSSISAQGLHAFAEKFFFNQSNGADVLRDELKLLLESEKDEPVSCLITDAVWHFTQSVADSLNLPRLVLRTSSLFCTLIYASIPLLDDLGYFKLVNTHLEEQVAEFPLLKVNDILKMGIKDKKDPFPELLRNMVKQMKASSGIIWNSCNELEGPELHTILRDFPVPSFLIPLPKYFTASSSSLLEQDQTVIPWLDHQPPNFVLYISFGSISHVDENDFMEIAHGLVNSKQSFLWVVRPGFVNGSTWLESLPDGFLGENGLVVKWAPQQQVLAHKAISAFWTHSGWNSTLESVCEGVPMICSPFRGDQPLDARYISDVSKVGVYLENGWNREEIASAIKKVMVDKTKTKRFYIEGWLLL